MVSLASNVTRTPKSSNETDAFWRGWARAVPNGSGRRDHPPNRYSVCYLLSTDRSSLCEFSLQSSLRRRYYVGFYPSPPLFSSCNDHVTGDSIRFDPIADNNGNLNFLIILSNDRFYGDKWGSLERGRVAIVMGKILGRIVTSKYQLPIYKYL